MLYRNEDGRFPSLLVEDGETVTLSVKSARETGIPILKMRPRSVAALLVLAGLPPPNAPRLSDRAAFERIEKTDGFVNFAELDEDGRLDGYSVPYIREVLGALDPDDRVPPKLVRKLFPLDEGHEDCGCTRRRRAGNASGVPARDADPADFAAASLSARMTHSVREAFVPDFVANLQVVSLFTAFGDIVVGRGGTLVLDADTNFVIADNFLAYRGSRIVQRGRYLSVDVTGKMRGSIRDIIHIASAALQVNWTALSAQSPTKP